MGGSGFHQGGCQGFAAGVEWDELVATQRELRIGFTAVVAELDFVGVGTKQFDHGADLSGLQFPFWQVVD